MAKPVRVKGSPHHHSRLTVPKDVRHLIGRTEFLAALRAPTEAQRQAEHLANIAAWKRRVEAARATLKGVGLRKLKDREISALCGVWYADRIETIESEGRLDRIRWAAEIESLLDEVGHDPEDPDWWDVSLTKRDLAAANAILMAHSLAVDKESLRSFAEALHIAKIDAARTLYKRATGDFSPDPVAEKFAKELPKPVQAEAPLEAPKAAPEVTFDTLARGWARDGGHDPDAAPIPRVYYDRKRTAARLAAFIGHDDAAKLTKADAARWKESIQKAGKSAKTVRNDLSEMSGLWRWGVRHGLVSVNVFEGLLPPKKATQNREKPVRAYTDAEASKLLGAARAERRASLRWLPWVLALSGARLGEIVQSVKEDIKVIEGVTVLRVHSEPGDRAKGESKRSLKTAESRRLVPIHPALIAEGFLDYVAALPAGSPLFPDILPDKLFGSRTNIAQKLLSRWVRAQGISTEDISPAHSFRHWFITAARKAKMGREARDAITGHSGKLNEADDYGVSVREMPLILYEEITKVPSPKGTSQNPATHSEEVAI